MSGGRQGGRGPSGRVALIEGTDGMRIYIAADHRGYRIKETLAADLRAAGHRVVDKGVHEEGRICDYPRLSYEVARAVASGRGARGILICMTGIGHSIAANKVPGAYAALCYTKEAAVFSRRHNNANILVLGARYVDRRELHEIVHVWLKERFEGGRHLRRVRQIKEIEALALEGTRRRQPRAKRGTSCGI